MNDIVKFCNKRNCEKSVLYNKLKTGGNDPNISSKMACSYRIQTYSRSRSTLTYESTACKIFDYKIKNGISPCPINKPVFVCNSPIFSGNNIYSSKPVPPCKCA